jgi:hypothetical protein
MQVSEACDLAHILSVNSIDTYVHIVGTVVYQIGGSREV